MGSAAYGQTLLEASSKLPVDWTVPFPALPLVPGGSVPCPAHLRLCPTAPMVADAYVDIRVLGRFTLKGVPELAVLAEALPRRLRTRSFTAPAGLVDRRAPIPLQSVSAQVSQKRNFGSELRRVRRTGSRQSVNILPPSRVDSELFFEEIPKSPVGSPTGSSPKTSFASERKLGLGANFTIGRQAPSASLRVSKACTSTRTDQDELAATV
jgi:hypothetical protein